MSSLSKMYQQLFRERIDRLFPGNMLREHKIRKDEGPESVVLHDSGTGPRQEDLFHSIMVVLLPPIREVAHEVAGLSLSHVQKCFPCWKLKDQVSEKCLI